MRVRFEYCGGIFDADVEDGFVDNIEFVRTHCQKTMQENGFGFAHENDMESIIEDCLEELSEVALQEALEVRMEAAQIWNEEY